MIPRIATRTAVLLMATMIGLSAAAADEIVETTDGRTILLHDDGRYEFVESRPETPAGTYRVIDFLDLQLDIDDMMGALIEVQANAQVFGGMTMLSPPGRMFDMNPIVAETDGLPRDDRAFLLQRCADSCRVTLRGEVAEIMFDGGLIVHELVR